MNEGVELIIMNTVMATTLVDVCVFMNGSIADVCVFMDDGHGGLAAAIWQKRRYKSVDVLLAPDEIWQEHLVASIFWR